MAQMTVQPGAVSERRVNLQTIANIAGAAISFALVIGIGIWGYKLLVRDVSGIPVVKAAEGPLKVQPQDPGGAEFQHQGLAVNNVAAEGAAEKPADRLVLAPEPLELSLEDTPQQIATLPDDEASAATAETAAETETAEISDEATQLTAAQIADQLAEGVEPLAPLQAAPEVETLPSTENTAQSDATAEESPEETAVTEGLGRSLRPQLRPTRVSADANAVAEAVAASVATASAANTSPLVDPAAIPAGTRMAQLGAYESAEIAAQEWTRLSGRFSEYLDDKQQVIQRAQSGGRTFYRLRAMGFDDLSDARRFCSALVAENAECIPVVTR